VLTSVRALLENKMEEAIVATRAFADGLVDPEASYYAAWQFAFLREKDDAVRMLNQAVERGFFSWPTLVNDSWLEWLRGDARFTRILASSKRKHEAARAAFEKCGGTRLLR
jgi:hypothetical protein